MPYSINLSNQFISVKGEFKEEFPFELTIQIYSNYENIGIEKGSEIVFLKENKNDENIFSYYGNVLDVERIPQNSNDYPNTKNLFQINIKIDGLLKENNSLNDLNYSLIKIENFKNPEKHFRRAYSHLFSTDYKTIIKNRIFISRTAFGKFVNSMHEEHRINFIHYFIENNPQLFFKDRDFVEALKLLEEYIFYHLLKPTEHLINSYSMLVDLVGEEISSEIGFWGEGEKNEIISDQLLHLNMKSQITDPKIIFDSTNEAIQEIQTGIQEYSSNENEMSKYFRNINWPIQI